MTVFWILIGLYGLVVGALTWTRPVLAAGLILATLPVYQIRFAIADIPLTLLEIELCVFVGIVFFRKRTQLRALISAPPLVPAALVAGFLAMGTLSLVWTPELTAGLGIWKAYVIEPVLLAVAVYLSLQKSADVAFLLRSIWILAIGVSVIALIQYATGFGIPEPWNAWPDRRAVGVFDYPNAVGLLLAPIISTAIAWLMYSRQWAAVWFQSAQQQKLSVILALLTTFLGSIAVLAARADGAIVSIVATTALLAVFTRFRMATIALCSLGLIAVLVVPQTREILLFQDVSGDVRLALWKGTVNLIQHQPFTGAGIGAFPQVYDSYRLPSHVELLQYPHNIVLDFCVEFGIFGPVWLIAFFGLTAKCLLSKRVRSYSATMLMIAPFFATMIYGLVDSPYFKNDLSVLFWLWIALSYFILMQSIKTPEQK